MSTVAETTQGGAVANVSAVDQLPAFMRPSESTGLELMKRFIRPERIKSVQKSAKEPLASMFNFGDTILVPSNTMLSAVALNAANKPEHAIGGKPFHIVPLFTFPEWCVWNPIKTQGTLPTIRDRSLDPKSEIAMLAQNPKLRESFPCPEARDEKLRYAEHLNFLCVIVGDNPIANSPLGELVAITFRHGSYKYGTQLLSLMNARRDVRTGQKANIWGCVFELTPKWESNQKGEYYALRPSNPSEASGMPPYVTDEAAYMAFDKKHTELQQAHADNCIVVDYDDDAPEGDAANPPNAKHEF